MNKKKKKKKDSIPCLIEFSFDYWKFSQKVIVINDTF
jgi:hypothetical protein